MILGGALKKIKLLRNTFCSKLIIKVEVAVLLIGKLGNLTIQQFFSNRYFYFWGKSRFYRKLRSQRDSALVQYMMSIKRSLSRRRIIRSIRKIRSIHKI